MQFQKIELEEFYSGEGVIFDKSVKYPFGELDYEEPLTPSIKSIKEAESIFSEKYYDYKSALIEVYGIEASKINEDLKTPENVIEKFYNYNRQYIAYQNLSKDTIITIGLLNFKNKRKANKYFKDSETTIQYGFHGFYEKNQEWISINISRNQIRFKNEK